MAVPITVGTGSASIAAEVVANLQYQRIEVLGQGGASVLAVNPDGSFNASVIGTPTVNAIFTGIGSIITVPSGSIITVWNNSSILAVPVGSTITVNQSSSIIGIVTGSVVAIPTGNQSVSGATTAPPGSVTAVRTDNASVITVSQSSSVVAVITGSVVAIPTGNQSVSGAITAPPGSIMQVFGSVQATQSTTPWVVTGSVQGIGSVAAFIVGNASVITVNQSSSIIAVATGSVIAVPSGSTIAVLQAPSIVGTYAEDSAHTTGDKGLFALQVRNDTMASVTSADGDYSPQAVGPVGEVMVANSPITKWIQGTADLRVVLGSSVQAIAAQGASIFTYITGVQVANMGPASVLVTFTGGKGSLLGYTIAPAGGGSNIVYPNALKTGENSGFSASLSGTASVLVTVQGFISKT